MKRASEQRAQHARSAYRFEWPEILDAGQPFPGVAFRQRDSVLPSGDLLRSRWTFLTYVAVVDPHAFDYPTVLLRRYASRGLQFVYVLPDSARTGQALDSYQLPDGIRMVIDDRNVLKARLSLPEADYVWSTFIRPDGVVAFSIPRFITSETMRQLVERALLGSVSYEPPRPAQRDLIGTSLPDIALERLRDGRRLRLAELPPEDSAVIFYRAHCTSCGLDSVIRQLEALNLRRDRLPHGRIYPIFSRAFASPELRELAAEPSVPELYLADWFVDVWEDAYLTSPSAANTAVVFFIDGAGRIKEARDLAEWYRETVDEPGTQPAAQDAAAAAAQPMTGYNFEEVRVGSVNIGWAGGLAAVAGRELLLLDRLNNRVLVLDPGGHLVRQLGGVGQGQGDLFLPMGMTVDRENVYVIDQDSARVQILALDGRSVARFRLDTVSDSVGVGSQGHIFLNTPRKGKLVTVYSREGKELRQFGDLVDRSRGFPGREDSAEMRIPLGRAHIVIAPDDSVYLAFNFMPLVQKYGPSGSLLWETRLQGTQMDGLVRSFWNEPGAQPARVVKKIDGIQFAHLITAAALGSDGQLLVAFADGSICAMSTNGHQIKVMSPLRRTPGPPRGLASLGDALYLATANSLYKSIRPVSKSIPSLPKEGMKPEGDTNGAAGGELRFRWKKEGL